MGCIASQCDPISGCSNAPAKARRARVRCRYGPVCWAGTQTSRGIGSKSDRIDLAVAEHLPPIFLRIARRFAAGILAGLDRVRQREEAARSPEGIAERRGGDPRASGRRLWRTQGGGAGRRRQRTVQRLKKELAAQPAGMPQCWVHPEPKYGAARLSPPIAREGRATNINSCTIRCRPAPTCRPLPG